MPKLTTTLSAALLATMAIGIAVPAQASERSHPARADTARYDTRYDAHHDSRFDHRHTAARAETIRSQIADLERRIARNDNRDRISEREAAALRRDVARLRDQFRAMNRNGLANAEYRSLQNRIDTISGRLGHERRDRDGRRG